MNLNLQKLKQQYKNSLLFYFTLKFFKIINRLINIFKFYSTINQTVRLSIAENGSPEGWFSDFTAGGSGYTYERQVEFLNTYILPYMKNHEYEECMAGSQTGYAYTCLMADS